MGLVQVLESDTGPARRGAASFLLGMMLTAMLLTLYGGHDDPCKRSLHGGLMKSRAPVVVADGEEVMVPRATRLTSAPTRPPATTAASAAEVAEPAVRQQRTMGSQGAGDAAVPAPRQGSISPKAFKLPESIPTIIEGAIPTVLWYPDDNAWEEDYVREIVDAAARGPVTFRKIYPRTTTSFRRHDVATLINDTTASNVIVFHGMIEDMQKCESAIPEKVQYYKPPVTFVFSDEHAASRCANNKLADMVPLTLRQYSQQSHRFPPRDNMKNMPLGYNTKASYTNRSQVKIASERQYDWTFVGSKKRTRAQMVEVLSRAFPNSKAHIDAYKQGQGFAVEMFRQARFVPNTQGQESYDCFRLYESSLAGAIPIQEVPKAKGFDTFGWYYGFEGTMPPWLFVENWNDAPRVMEPYLKNLTLADEKQQECLAWWDKAYNNMVEGVRRELEVDQLVRKSKAAAAAWWAEQGREDVGEVVKEEPRPAKARGDREKQFEAPPPPPPRGAGIRRA